MSQTTKMQKLTIRNRPGKEGEVSHGANTEILLDGHPMKGVSFIKIECKPAKITKVMIEMYVEVDAEIYSKLTKEEPKRQGYKDSRGKYYGIHTVSSLEPTALAERSGEEG